MHWNWRTADRTGSTRATARGVSRMPSGARVSNSSPSSFLSRPRLLLMADWPTFRWPAARVTLRSVRSASRATSR